MALIPGISERPGYLAGVPGARDVQREYFGLVSELAFVPPDWIQQVKAAMVERPDSFFQLVPVWATGFGGPKVPGLPTWLDTSEKDRAWQALATHQKASLKKVIDNYNAAVMHVYLAEMRSKAFWDSIREPVIAVATVLRDIPKTVVGAAGDVASGAATTAVKKILPFILIAGAALVAFFVIRSKLKK